MSAALYSATANAEQLLPDIRKLYITGVPFGDGFYDSYHDAIRFRAAKFEALVTAPFNLAYARRDIAGEYLPAVASIVEQDPAFVASIWNEKGFADVDWHQAAALLRDEWSSFLKEQRREVARSVERVDQWERSAIARGFKELAAQFRDFVTNPPENRFDSIHRLRLEDQAGGLFLRGSAAGLFERIHELAEIAREYETCPEGADFRNSTRRPANLFSAIIGGALPSRFPEIFGDPISDPAIAMPRDNDDVDAWFKVSIRHSMHLEACACDLLSDLARTSFDDESQPPQRAAELQPDGPTATGGFRWNGTSYGRSKDVERGLPEMPFLLLKLLWKHREAVSLDTVREEVWRDPNQEIDWESVRNHRKPIDAMFREHSIPLRTERVPGGLILLGR